MRELGRLVVHERDERGDHKTGAAAGKCWELIAETFSGAGWHDQQDVFAFGRSTANGFLIDAEVGEAKGAVKEGAKISHA